MLDWGLSKRWQMVRRRQTKEELKRRGRHVMWNRRRERWWLHMGSYGERDSPCGWNTVMDAIPNPR